MATIWERAQQVIPGGVNSPVRSFSKVGAAPLFVKNASGAFVTDNQDHQYLDYIFSWGALIFGHGYQPVLEKVMQQLTRGTSYGLATELEVEFAEKLVAAVPSLEMVRLVNSGTEATMSALRVARGFTGRNKIVKFSGCYHGHSNELLVAAGSGAMTFGAPESAGVTENTAGDTLVLPFNILNAVEDVFQKFGDNIAAVIVEPVAANMGLVLPREGFLTGLRQITRKYNSLLIFDEVITGFRVSYGGAQEFYGVIPDLTCLGKIIGGGFPIGAYGGRKEIMEMVSPLGPVYQAGTLSGNPMAVTAGLETLKLLQDPVIYDNLGRKGEFFREGLKRIGKDAEIELQVTGLGSLTGLFFGSETVRDYETAGKVDDAMYRKFFTAALEEMLLFPPSPFETIFLATVSSEKYLADTLAGLERVFRRIN